MESQLKLPSLGPSTTDSQLAVRTCHWTIPAYNAQQACMSPSRSTSLLPALRPWPSLGQLATLASSWGRTPPQPVLVLMLLRSALPIWLNAQAWLLFNQTTFARAPYHHEHALTYRCRVASPHDSSITECCPHLEWQGPPPYRSSYACSQAIQSLASTLRDGNFGDCCVKAGLTGSQGLLACSAPPSHAQFLVARDHAACMLKASCELSSLMLLRVMRSADPQ